MYIDHVNTMSLILTWWKIIDPNTYLMKKYRFQNYVISNQKYRYSRSNDASHAPLHTAYPIISNVSSFLEFLHTIENCSLDRTTKLAIIFSEKSIHTSYRIVISVEPLNKFQTLSVDLPFRPWCWADDRM